MFKILGKIAIDNSEANRSIDDTTGKVEHSESRMSTAFKKIGTAIVTYLAVDKIKDFGKACVQMSADVAAEQSAFEQIMGDYSDTAQKKVNELADATGMVNSRLTPYMTSMTAKFKGLGYDVGDATDYAQQGLNIAADAAAFWDKSLDDSMSALNSFVNGSYEGGEAIGLFANDTRMASYAVESGLISQSKEWANLDEKTKQATRLEYAENMQKASGAVGQAAKESEQYANVQANLAEKWRQFKAQIGDPILQNIVLPAMEKLGNFITEKLQPGFEVLKEKVKELSSWYKEHKTVVDTAIIAIGGFVAALAAMSIINSVKNWIKGLKTAFMALNTTMLANPIFLIIAAIAALVAAFIYLWNNCDGFRQFWIDLWENIKEVAIAVWEKIKEVWEVVQPYFEELWNKIKEIVLPVWEGIREVIVAVWGKIKEVWDTVSPYFVALWNKIKEIVPPIWDSIKAVFSAAWTKIKQVWDKAQPFFKAIWDGIKQIFSVVKTYIGGAFSTAWTAIKAVWDNVKGYFQAVWNTIKGIFSVVKSVLSGNWSDAWNSIKGIVNTWKEYFQGVWDNIMGVFGKVKSWFSETFSGAWSAVKDVFAPVGEFFGGLWDTIKEKFTDFGTKIGDTVGGAIKGAVNGAISLIEGAVNLVPNAINGAIDMINNLPGVSISPINAVSLPRLATGGIVDRATIAQIGEDGAEAVVPLERNTQWIDLVAGKVSSAMGGGNNSEVVSKLNELIDTLKDQKIYLDSGALVGGISGEMDSALGSMSRLKRRGVKR